MNKILIVEDDHNLGIMIRDILQFSGYDVMLSKKPEQTVDNLLNNDINLVLMDKLMSGIDGTEVCGKIRNTDGISHIPVLMMSALSDIREVCMDAGATDFIYKPFEIGLLRQKIEDILREN